MAFGRNQQEMRPRPDLGPLLDPRSIAVIGASSDLTRIGGLPISLLMQTGFSNVYAINPKYDRIGSIPCVPAIEDVPDGIDLAIVATSAQGVLNQLERAHRKGVRAAVVFASGFAETGEAEGMAMQAAIVEFAKRTGMIINGPNCLGIVNWTTGVFATFSRALNPDLPAGSTALLSQSGNISAAIFRIARRMNVTFSYAISTGNEACVEAADYLNYLADDPNTNTVLCYMEALRDGPGFLAAASRLRRAGKMLVVYKAGTSEKGAEAARSHTAALAGDRAAYEAAFQACGVMVAEDLPHLAELAYLHRFAAKRALGPGVGIISISGAAGAIMSDGLSAGNMTVPTLPETVQAELRTFIPSYGMAANPVDLTGNGANKPGNLGLVVEHVLSAACIDVLILYLGDQSLKRGISDLKRIASETNKLVLVVDTFESGFRQAVEDCGIPYFEEIGQAVRALTSYVAWKQAEIAEPVTDQSDKTPLLLEFQTITKGNTSRNLSEVAAKSLLAAAGLRVVQDMVVQDAAAAVGAAETLGYPVVLKLVSPDVAHKTEIGAVRLGIANGEAVTQAYREIMASARSAVPNARIEGIAVEPFIQDAKELLLGVVKDPVFGWMMTVGLGGIWTELIGDVSHALLPIDTQSARAMLRRLKTFPLLQGFRGSPPADIEAACQAIASLSSAVLSLGDVIEDCEINPLLVLREGSGAIAADALITLSH